MIATRTYKTQKPLHHIPGQNYETWKGGWREMLARLSVGLILAILGVHLQAQTPGQQTTVIGKLGRVMAIGGESTGWAIQLDSETSIEGKRVDSLEVDDSNTERLEKLANKRVKATGTLSHRKGLETGERLVLVVSSMKEVKATSESEAAKKIPFNLAGTEWLLEDLGGAGVIENVQATLTFPEAGKTVGNGSCNRFFGPAEITGSTIELGPLGSTRMACPEAVMNQETKYLDALQAAERFEWKDPYLLIYCKGFEKPLRFTRMKTPKPATP
jgi:heat shock protein HslJ